MSVVPHAQYLAVLSEVIVHLPGRAVEEGPMLLQSRNSETHQKKMVGVSRGGVPY